MAFVIAAMIAQLPASLPAGTRTNVIEAIKTTDPRMKPSSLPCFDRLRQCALRKKAVSIVDVVQCLAHAHWSIDEAGPYAFAYKSFVSLGIDHVIDYYNFDWSMGDTPNVLGRDGEPLRIVLARPAGRRRIQTHLRKRFEDTKEGKKLIGQKVFTFEGVTRNGDYLYKMHYDTLNCTLAQLEDNIGKLDAIKQVRKAMVAVSVKKMESHDETIIRTIQSTHQPNTPPVTHVHHEFPRAARSVQRRLCPGA